MRQLVKTVYGSHLYGLNTPNSDKDFEGVFLPDLDEVLMYGAPKTLRDSTNAGRFKNSAEDVDYNNMSLQFFLKQACSGQTIQLNMLHTPDEHIILQTETWKELRRRRHEFYTCDMEAYLGYCRHQAAKYGIKGSRMNAVKSMIDFFSMCCQDHLLSDYWGNMPKGEHIDIQYEFGRGSQPIRQVAVCGRKFQDTVRVGYALVALRGIYDNYGERARQAQASDNIDWKAISHAFRAGYELKEIYETCDLIYPLRDRDFIMKVKLGEFHYKNDGIDRKLEDLVAEVQELAAKSDFPQKCELDNWKGFVLDCY